jgi:hypothetical protein
MVVVAAAYVATGRGARKGNAGCGRRVFVGALLFRCVVDRRRTHDAQGSRLAAATHGDGFGALQEALWLLVLLGWRRWELLVLVGPFVLNIVA